MHADNVGSRQFMDIRAVSGAQQAHTRWDVDGGSTARRSRRRSRSQALSPRLHPSHLPCPPPPVPTWQAIRDHSKIVMGKNTMMRRSIRLYCERTGNDHWLCLLDHLIGNVGIIFTKGDLNEVRATPATYIDR